MAKIPNWLMEFFQEIGAELINDFFLQGHFKAKGKTATSGKPSQEQLNAELMIATTQMSNTASNPTKDRLDRRLQMAARHAIPERHGVVHKISQDALVEALTNLPKDANDSWVPALEKLAELNEDKFWIAIDIIWQYSFAARTTEKAQTILIDLFNSATRNAGFTAGATASGARAVGRTIDNAATRAAPHVERQVNRLDAFLVQRGY